MQRAVDQMLAEDGALAGRYRLITIVGRGGASTVWRAYDERLDRAVAVKLYTRADDDTRARARREIDVLGRLDHPSVMDVLDGDPSADEPYLVLPYLRGETLDRYTRSRRVDSGALEEWLGVVADGLAHAHALGIWHRDVKPSNIMIVDEERPILIDWGLGKHDEMTQVTRVNRIVGTAEFFAPEVLKGATASGASDVWAWGVSAYLSMSGTAPFVGTSLSEILIAQETPPAPLPWRWRSWNRVFRSIFVLDPAARPTAAEIASWCRTG